MYVTINFILMWLFRPDDLDKASQQLPSTDANSQGVDSNNALVSVIKKENPWVSADELQNPNSNTWKKMAERIIWKVQNNWGINQEWVSSIINWKQYSAYEVANLLLRAVKNDLIVRQINLLKESQPNVDDILKSVFPLTESPIISTQTTAPMVAPPSPNRPVIAPSTGPSTRPRP